MPSFTNHGTAPHPDDGIAGQVMKQAAGVAPGGKVTGTYILVILLRLRQCCSHLSLLKEVSTKCICTHILSLICVMGHTLEIHCTNIQSKKFVK